MRSNELLFFWLFFDYMRSNKKMLERLSGTSTIECIPFNVI